MYLVRTIQPFCYPMNISKKKSTKESTKGITIDAIAKPLPSNLGLILILIREMIPKINPNPGART